ncbi:unnamed protein product [Closterium sp. NIES-64]|nr:unnamed protein product [Closterium sp. NIES-64]
MPPSSAAEDDPSSSAAPPCHVSSPPTQTADLVVDYDSSVRATSSFHHNASVPAQAGVRSAFSCFGFNGDGASCASAEESERENGEEEEREDGRKVARESEIGDRNDLDSTEGAEGAEGTEGAEEAEEAEGADGNESDDGGYEFRGLENETEMAMLAESTAEVGLGGKGVAEKGAAEGAEGAEGAKGHHRRQSWLTSVEWFVSWPLRRLSHPWRKSLGVNLQPAKSKVIEGPCCCRAL